MAELEKKVAEEAKKVEEATAKAKTATDEAQAKFDEVNETVKAYKSAIDELTDDYNATLGYIENLKEVPKGEESKDFSGGVSDEEAPTDDAKQPDEVPTVPNAPEFNGGVNPADAPTAEEKPEFNGGVNDEEAPTTENTPEFNGGVNDGEAPTTENTPEFNGGVNDTTPPTEPNKPEGDAPKPTKPEASNGDALVQPALPEFGANNPEFKKILDEIAKVKEQIKDGEENGAEDYYLGGLKSRLEDLEEAFNILSQNLPAVNEVPEYTGPTTLETQPNTQPQPTPSNDQGGAGQQGGGAAGEVVDPSQNLGSVSGASAAQNVDFGQTPAVTQLSTKPEEAKSEELASTGMNSSSTTALGLSLIGLIGLAVRRKLSK